MFVDDSACNLASLNLMKFFNAEDGSFDVENFRHACDVVITAQEMLVDNASYPTPAIAENSHKFRPLGLGYANLGALLMATGIPYDSDEGRAYAAAITSLMCGEAYLQSSKIAAELGPSPATRPTATPSSTSSACTATRPTRCPATRACRRSSLKAQKAVWDAALESGTQYGYKNGQVTVLAPTGTIGFMMDCDTTGVEPDLALVKYKKLVGGGTIKIVNQTVPLALKRLGYDRAADQRDRGLRRREGDDRGRAGLQARAPARLRLRVPRVERHALDPLHGARPDDGGRAAVPLRRDLQDRQPAARRHARRDRRRLHGRLEAGPEGHRDLPRRLQAHAAAEHRGVEERHQVTPRSARRLEYVGKATPPVPAALPPQAPRRAPLDHPQVQRRRPRGLHHRRPLRGRQARRDLPDACPRKARRSRA